jgi:hypothetical protein
MIINVIFYVEYDAMQSWLFIDQSKSLRKD